MVAFVFVFGFLRGYWSLFNGSRPAQPPPPPGTNRHIPALSSQQWKVNVVQDSLGPITDDVIPPLYGSLLCRFTLVCEKGWSCPGLEAKAALKKQSKWTGIMHLYWGKCTGEKAEVEDKEWDNNNKKNDMQKMWNGPHSYTVVFSTCWNFNREPTPHLWFSQQEGIHGSSTLLVNLCVI